MYTYITGMTRTQIYLSDEETSVLDRLARQTGLSRSQLIRDAIGKQYRTVADPERLIAVLRKTSGAWRGRRPSGRDAVERLRSGRLARLHGRGED
jgi:predicted DNA-binding protein